MPSHTMPNRSPQVGKGALFKNDRKQSERHADYKGNVNVNGEEFWIDAWVNESKTGTKYLSLRLKPKRPANAGPRPAFNDEVPW